MHCASHYGTAIANQYGIEDDAPVTHENFRQWVIEDNFCAGRPDWQNVGVQFTDTVHDFELMKIRILNGGHQVISVPAGARWCENNLSDCMENDLIRRLFEKVARDEIVPHVKAVPGMSPIDYVDAVFNVGSQTLKLWILRVVLRSMGRHATLALSCRQFVMVWRTVRLLKDWR